jgi:hypothetical protein
MMPRFNAALQDWNSSAFNETLKSELEALPPGILPLLQAASRGVPDDREIRIMLLDAVDDQDCIQVKVGIFFNEILAGCSCGDQPMSLQSYCELQVDIDKRTAEARFSLLDDEPS